MLSFFTTLAARIISTLLFALKCFLWPVLVFFFSLLKIILPFAPLRRIFDRILPWLAENWIASTADG